MDRENAYLASIASLIWHRDSFHVHSLDSPMQGKLECKRSTRAIQCYLLCNDRSHVTRKRRNTRSNRGLYRGKMTHEVYLLQG